MSNRPTFVFTSATNSRDMKTRPAVCLYLNGAPTNQFAYSKERARAMVHRAHREGVLPLFHLNRVLGEISKIQQLPERCVDFPRISICQCTQHGVLIDADGEDFNMHPAYSQAVLLARLNAEHAAGNISDRDLPALVIAIQRSSLPKEVQPEDQLAERMGLAIQLQVAALLGRFVILPQGQVNWCDIHSLASRELNVRLIVPDADQDQ